MNKINQTPENRIKFAEFLENERKMLEFTKVQMAKALNMSYSMYLKISKNERKFPVHKLQKLSELLMISASSVYNRYYGIERLAISVKLNVEYLPEVSLIKVTSEAGELVAFELTDEQNDALSETML